MTGDPATTLLALGSSPWAIALAIVLATFVLEDVATITAAFLAATGEIAAPIALAALFVGIFAGDLGLYGLGAAARTREWARNVIGERRMVKGRGWLKRRYIPALIGARFMPGFRLPTYAASGFLKLPFWPFAGVAAGAGFIWTTLIFSLVFFFGVMIVENLGVWRWALAAILLTFILAGPTLAERFAHRTAEPGDV
ncbi:MAG: VTT domain-containing protein [Alphaproteobacteria bacterium]|jgi:membrane protein DedA with SNARE-associated domain|nr:VTT domain-containing protein [Alphaproteobacteria bacterium]